MISVRITIDIENRIEPMVRKENPFISNLDDKV